MSTVDSLTGPVQPDLLLHGPRARDRPRRPVGPGVLPGHAGPRRPEVGQRPFRPPRRRPGPARASPTRSAAASARSTSRPATAATSSSRSCPRPTRPAAGCSPRRSGSTCREQGMPGIDPRPDGLGRRRLLPGRRPRPRTRCSSAPTGRCTPPSAAARTGYAARRSRSGVARRGRDPDVTDDAASRPGPRGRAGRLTRGARCAGIGAARPRLTSDHRAPGRPGGPSPIAGRTCARACASGACSPRSTSRSSRSSPWRCSRRSA